MNEAAVPSVTGEVPAAIVACGAAVVPVPEADHAPSPSALLARTCTWYDVAGERLPIAVEVVVTSCGPSVQSPLVPGR